MKYVISNDPDYEKKEEERKKQEEQRKKQEEQEKLENYKRYQEYVEREAKWWLDQVQYAIDNKLYSKTIDGHFWNKKKYVRIDFSTDAFSKRYFLFRPWSEKGVEKEKIEVKRDIMNKTAEMIEHKFPQWEVWGYAYTDKLKGSYGIGIKCSPEDFCD